MRVAVCRGRTLQLFVSFVVIVLFCLVTLALVGYGPDLIEESLISNMQQTRDTSKSPMWNRVLLVTFGEGFNFAPLAQEKVEFYEEKKVISKGFAFSMKDVEKEFKQKNKAYFEQKRGNGEKALKKKFFFFIFAKAHLRFRILALEASLGGESMETDERRRYSVVLRLCQEIT